MLKIERFWYKKNLFSYCLGIILLSISLINILVVVVFRAFIKPKKHNVPVIAVGGATVGGSGKTPVTIAIVKVLKSMGKNPHIITRGYGKASSFNEEVLYEDSYRYGDEAILLYKHARTWSGGDKNTLIEMAINAGADIVVLDDGMQSFNVYKDVQILVINSAQGIGNGMVIPSGPLREPFFILKNRADFIIVLNDSAQQCSCRTNKSILYGDILETLEIDDKKVVAFCAIGYPEKFLFTLRRLGKDVVKFIEYPDHYAYTKKDLLYLVDISRKFQAKLVTTEKDLVKIAPNLRRKFNIVEIAVNVKGLSEILTNLLK